MDMPPYIEVECVLPHALVWVVGPDMCCPPVKLAHRIISERRDQMLNVC